MDWIDSYHTELGNSDTKQILVGGRCFLYHLLSSRFIREAGVCDLDDRVGP